MWQPAQRHLGPQQLGKDTAPAAPALPAQDDPPPLAQLHPCTAQYSCPWARATGHHAKGEVQSCPGAGTGGSWGWQLGLTVPVAWAPSGWLRASVSPSVAVTLFHAPGPRREGQLHSLDPPEDPQHLAPSTSTSRGVMGPLPHGAWREQCRARAGPARGPGHPPTLGTALQDLRPPPARVQCHRGVWARQGHLFFIPWGVFGTFLPG